MTSVMRPLPWHWAEFERLLPAPSRELAHALLLRGPRGVGKLDFARALAAALLCETPARDRTACGLCQSCNWLRAGSHPDYRELQPVRAGESGLEANDERRASSSITIDPIRALADFVNISSHRGGAKVILIHPGEALNPNAANALLKSLEEPPAGTHFVLATHRPHQLLPTIRSRCLQIGLPAPTHACASAWLEAEGVSEPQLALAHSGGAPLLARELAGGAYWARRSAFLRILTLSELDIVSAGEALRDFSIAEVLGWLQKWSYDLARLQAHGSVRYNPDYRSELDRASARADRLAVLRFTRETVRLQAIAQHPLNARLFIEDLLLAYQDVFRSEARS
jgi:DNA polymerase III subunit delta'